MKNEMTKEEIETLRNLADDVVKNDEQVLGDRYKLAEGVQGLLRILDRNKLAKALYAHTTYCPSCEVKFKPGEPRREFDALEFHEKCFDEMDFLDFKKGLLKGKDL